MNKIAQYLNEHILGEVSSVKSLRRRFSQDQGPLAITPEIVIFPKVTNDIRKVARFTWQLAEKGHVVGITVRGGGSDKTGAAIGKGIVINTTRHLDSIINLGIKERAIHLQAGVSVRNAAEVLRWNGLGMSNLPTFTDVSTIGGMLANNRLGERGTIAGMVEKLEVILANGDLIETGRISKRELSKKRGLETFEGEIYRKIGGIIEDNEKLIAELDGDNSLDRTGYATITRVREKDGSFDLTPLFLGSQGTLGIISETVLKTDFNSKYQTVLVGIVPTKEVARDTLDAIKKLDPAVLEMIDGELFQQAQESGKNYTVLGDQLDVVGSGSLIYVGFNDFNERAQGHKAKKLEKLFQKQNIVSFSSEKHSFDDLRSLRDVTSVVSLSLTDSESMPPIVDGASVPEARREEFFGALAELATKLHVKLPTKINGVTDLINVYPVLHLGEVSDKQKLFRLINEYSVLVTKCDGRFIADAGEGRLKSNAAWAHLDEETTNLYQQIRETFDPFGTLNPGVKQKNDIKHLIESLRGSYDIADIIDRGISR